MVKECKYDFSTIGIIGGGMGGLFTGAILTKLGYRVNVYEKNQIIGGGLQSFRRDGAYFNPSMHNFGGFGDEWALSHILNFLGVKKVLRVMPVDEDAQEIIWTDKTHCYRLPRGREKFEKYLTTLFPEQKDGIHGYLDALYVVANSFDNFYLRPHAFHAEASEFLNMKLLQLLRHFISDEELIKVLCFLSPLCGLHPSEIPVSLYSMLAVLYISGEYRFIDNSLQLANALKEVICSKGGNVETGVEISEINVKDAHVIDIAATDGRRFKADAYVAAITPKLLYSIATENVVKSVTLKRTESFKTDTSAFSIYVRLRPNTFPYINSTLYLPLVPENASLPLYMVVTTPPVSNQGKWAETMEILVPVFYEPFSAWSDTVVQRRGDDYESFKRRLAENIISYVASFYNILPCIQSVHTASPLTIRDYYNNPNGAVYSQMGLGVSIRTRTDNLFVTGQSVLFHGLCGVPLTSILVAEAISGKDVQTEIRNATGD